VQWNVVKNKSLNHPRTSNIWVLAAIISIGERTIQIYHYGRLVGQVPSGTRQVSMTNILVYRCHHLFQKTNERSVLTLNTIRENIMLSRNVMNHNIKQCSNRHLESNLLCPTKCCDTLFITPSIHEELKTYCGHFLFVHTIQTKWRSDSIHDIQTYCDYYDQFSGHNLHVRNPHCNIKQGNQLCR